MIRELWLDTTLVSEKLGGGLSMGSTGELYRCGVKGSRGGGGES